MNRRYNQGFTLVELMVSMVLGLVVVGGVISVLVANRNSYRTNEGLSQVQESARTAFELLARDVRQTGSTGCDNARRMANVLNNPTTVWWRTWVSVQGFDGVDTAVTSGAGVGQRVAGTDTIHLHSIQGGGYPVATHTVGTQTITLNVPATPVPQIAIGDIMMICDFDHAAIFQATGWNGANTITHAASGTPGNCSTGLGFPTDCVTPNVYPFARNSWVGKLQAVTWYIGNNGRVDDGGRSLYRVRLDTGGALVTEEIVSGVTDMQITYGRNGSDTVSDATAVTTATAWPMVNSVFVTLTVNSTDQRVSTSSAVASGRLTRTFTYLVALRNRVP